MRVPAIGTGRAVEVLYDRGPARSARRWTPITESANLIPDESVPLTVHRGVGSSTPGVHQPVTGTTGEFPD